MYIFLKNSHNQIGMLVLFLLLVIILSLLVQFILKKTLRKGFKSLIVNRINCCSSADSCGGSALFLISIRDK